MAVYCRVYDSHHLQADCQEPGSAAEPYATKCSAILVDLLRTGYVILHGMLPILCVHNGTLFAIGNESVPIQLAQYWFPGLTISSVKI